MNSYINIPEYEVSQFNRLFKEVIETNFDYVRIKGEISEIKNATKGQIYLTLKDNDSILSGVIWDNKKKYLKFNPEQGMEVIVTGKITTWSKYKTTYQIDIDKVELSGEGALLKLIEDRKKKLKAQGLFDEGKKRKLPFLPNKIGVITSPTGSVIHDIINRISERFPVNIDIWPVSVQGQEAVENIIEAIEGFENKNYHLKPEVLIIARGGGSTEDLMTFNSEKLAIAVFNSHIPIISAIGHETDTTIVDYVSDLRASTPTAAAEKAVPMRNELIYSVNNLSQRLVSFVENYFKNLVRNFENLSKFLRAPNFVIQSFKEKLNKINHELLKKFNNLLMKKNERLNNYMFLIRPPKNNFDNKKKEFKNIVKNFNLNFDNIKNFKNNELNKLSRLLNSNSISLNLKKGYSIVRKSNKILTRSNQINKEDLINVQFLNDSLDLKVKKTN